MPGHGTGQGKERAGDDFTVMPHSSSSSGTGQWHCMVASGICSGTHIQDHTVQSGLSVCTGLYLASISLLLILYPLLSYPIL